MIVLNKKTIIIFILGIFIVAFGFVFISEKEETAPTASFPVSDKTIVIDAGHGGEDRRSKFFNWNF